MSNPTPEDIAEFKRYIQGWKSVANNDDPILELYREKPNYLLIPIMFALNKGNERAFENQLLTNKVNNSILALAFIALLGTYYGIVQSFNLIYFGLAFVGTLFTEILLIVILGLSR